MKREACLVVVLEKVAGPGTDGGDRDAECLVIVVVLDTLRPESDPE